MRRFVPFLFATLVAFVHVGLMLRAALHRTHGVFCYPLDDAFIHLALARHIAFDGVYGITKYAFSASSSSIAWPWMLATVMRVFGDHVTIPFFLNLLSGAALIGVMAWGLDREAPGSSLPARTLVLLLVAFLVPLATLMMIGMEHVLHAAVTIAFVLEAARLVGRDDAPSGRELARTAALAAALTMTRYEGMFAVGIVVVALAARRRFVPALAVAAAGAAPIVLFGVWSIAHGGLFFPNSIALKRQHIAIKSVSDVTDLLGLNVLGIVRHDPHILPLLVGTLAAFVLEARRVGPWGRDAVRCALAFLATVAHVQFASLNWFYRYEAYLIALDLLVIAIALLNAAERASLFAVGRRSPAVAIGFALAVIVACAPLGSRASDAQSSTPLACQNIYQQQVQTAHLLARAFPHDTVAVNDVGAVAYYGDEPVVDLVGLGTLDVARAKGFQMDTVLTEEQMRDLTAGAPVAVLYDEWFPHVPPSWVRVARLRIDGNTVCGSASVSVYATSGEQVPRVIAALRDYEPSLPEQVHREGRFVEAPHEARGAWRADTGDLLYVEMRGAPELSAVLYVGDDGSFYPPKIGEVKARGKTLEEIEAATVARIAKPFLPVPPGIEPHVRLMYERGCRAIVAGNVLHSIDTIFDCGTNAAKALALAGLRSPSARAEGYVLREAGGAFTRIPLAYDPADPAAARALVLQEGDVLIVN